MCWWMTISEAAQQLGRFKLPQKRNQKASYAELLTIVLVGEVLQQKNQGLWYLLVKSDYRTLFPVLPELSRFYRISRNFERIYADLALLLAEHDGVYLIDSQPLPICKGIRYTRDRLLSEALQVAVAQANASMVLDFTPSVPARAQSVALH